MMMKHQYQNSNISQRLGHHIPVTGLLIITLTTILLCGILQVEGGCSRFGHSCFGAHGKRGGGPDVMPNTIEIGADGRLMEVLAPGAAQAGESYPFNFNSNYPSSVQNLNGLRLSPYFMEWVNTRRELESKAHQNQGVKDESPALEMKK